MIYGVAVLAACTILGKIAGSILGFELGTGSDLGGVGFGMLLLLYVTNSKRFEPIRTETFSRAINFCRSLFIPVVVAMTASQDVAGAMSCGAVAILSGLIPVLVAFVVLAIVSRLMKEHSGKEGKLPNE